MSIRLSHRLQTIASHIPPQMHVADIGGDHAFLLLFLAEQGILGKGVVSDVNQGPYERAKHRVSHMGWSSYIDVRRGNGLEVLSENEVDVIVIAGMGGELIWRMLDHGVNKIRMLSRLIVQPNNGVAKVRKWLYRNGFALVNEDLIQEQGILYEVLIAEPGDVSRLYRHDLIAPEYLFHVGPILWKKRHPLLRLKLETELIKKKSILMQLRQSNTELTQIKQKKLEKDIIIWKEVIECLSRGMI